MRIWKLIGLATVTAGLAGGLPVLLTTLNVMTFSDRAWLVVGLTMAGLVLKLLVADAAGKGIDYHRQGHDFCVTSLVGSLSALAFQITSSTDLFPRLVGNGLWQRLFAAISPSIVTQRIAFLVCLVVASALLSLFTARTSKAIEEGQARAAALLSLMNFVVGSTLLSGYLLIVVTRV